MSQGRMVGVGGQEGLAGLTPTEEAQLVKVGREQGVGGPSSLWLGFPPGPVLVVWVVSHVLGSDPLGFVNERSFVRLGEHLPLRAQLLADLRIVHLRVFLGDLTALHAGPHHEGVHWALDVLSPEVGEVEQEKKQDKKQGKKQDKKQ